MNIDMNLENIEMKIYLIKTIFMSLCTYFTFCKITNNKTNLKQNWIILFIGLIFISVLVTLMRYKLDAFTVIAGLIFLLSLLFAKITKSNLGYAILIVIISYSFSYILFVVAIMISFIVNLIHAIKNDFLNLGLMMLIQTYLLHKIFKLKRLKNGIDFLKNSSQDKYIDIIILNICVVILFSAIIFISRNILIAKSLFIGFIISSVVMFITIQKSLQLYYKQKLLVQELEQTKQELADKKKEVEDLEAENIKISKNAHTLSHKQKSLEYKIEEMINKTEISKEEAAEVRDRLKEIGKDLYKEKTTIELDKTGITEIDDMLKYMQSECKKNKIDFELQLKGNIHHMTNNLITKEDLETLLADHIKNAIIAINHTDNINRSILVRLGKIDETYGLYIYDSGIEFEPETLENLGKKPSTTHADEGGTGMGFMNTFDTLRKCNASLIIEEYNEPSKDNYTKALLIKFDNKNEFKIKTYHTL